ncbi:TIGR01906 family membrane protein [Arthrobacter sp. SDTb3-6]|uniref:TIGR01906 family membrane protein n=1 Tax=Arthrobacter sp. SDTb3-6 TaxID=2713571 RepID=UPI0035238A63
MTENQPQKAPAVPAADSTPATPAKPGVAPSGAAPSGAAPAAYPGAGSGTPAAEPAVSADSAASTGAEGAPGTAGSGAAAPAGAPGQRPAPAQSSASRIKIDMPADGIPEPMRPATRMPKLPADSDPESADSAQAGAARASGPGAATAPSATQGTYATAPASAGNNAGPAKAEAVDAGTEDVYVEQSPTSMLQVRPPQEEVDRRLAARQQAANTKPVLPRVFQVLLAVFYPVVLLVLAIRLVTTNAFLWIEYHRPGFPVDSFGFSTDDRLTYGSYTVDYLLNFAGRRYLGDLVNPQGTPLFLEREVAHMADVKSLIDFAFLLGLVLAIVMVIGIIYLSRRSTGGVRRGLFAGSIVTLVLIIGLGVLAFMGWETFFTDFHRIFFANGTWTFYTDDTLIRLFPSQFWSDAGIFIGAFVLVVSSLTLAFTWPTKDRRQAVVRAKRPGRRAAAQ